MTAATLLPAGEHWIAVKDGDDRARALYLRHYSARPRSKTGNYTKFTGPGEHVLLMTVDCLALFLWRFERYRKDGQEGINCAIFRNESAVQSSTLIQEACKRAWERWPAARLFTYVNPRRIRSTNPGYCFKKAGFRRCGMSKGGLVILERLPEVA